MNFSDSGDRGDLLREKLDAFLDDLKDLQGGLRELDSYVASVDSDNADCPSNPKSDILPFKSCTLRQMLSELDSRISEIGGDVSGIYDSFEKVAAEPSDSERILMLETLETERHRISRDLHDSTVQNLIGLVHKIDLCSNLIDRDPIRCKLELTVCGKVLHDTIDETRSMIYNLRPMSFDDIGFIESLDQMLRKLDSESTSCNVRFKLGGEVASVSPIIGISIMRIVQEACSNAIRHGSCSDILVSLFFEEGAIRLGIKDDGDGFDLGRADLDSRSDNSGFGLAMMRERVFLLSGTLDIVSEIGKGTSIDVSIPLRKE